MAQRWYCSRDWSESNRATRPGALSSLGWINPKPRIQTWFPVASRTPRLASVSNGLLSVRWFAETYSERMGETNLSCNSSQDGAGKENARGGWSFPAPGLFARFAREDSREAGWELSEIDRDVWWAFSEFWKPAEAWVESFLSMIFPYFHKIHVAWCQRVNRPSSTSWDSFSGRKNKSRSLPKAKSHLHQAIALSIPLPKIRTGKPRKLKDISTKV